MGGCYQNSQTIMALPAFRNAKVLDNTRIYNKVRELIAVSATYLIAEYHHGRLQSTPLGKLCTDASA